MRFDMRHVVSAWFVFGALVASLAAGCDSEEAAPDGDVVDTSTTDEDTIQQEATTSVCTDDSACVGLVDVGACQVAVCRDNGACGVAPQANGTACEDDDPCTLVGQCSAGVCVGAGEVDCDDGNPCTDDRCEAGVGCVTTFHSGGCDDGSACTSGDTCFQGKCVGQLVSCDDGNPCTDDRCDEALGCVSVNNDNPCLDGDACTTNDHCEDGVCVGTTIPGCAGPECGDGICQADEDCVTCNQDCPTCCPPGEVASCTGGCTYADWVGDGTCDPFLDCQETGWDGGDCEPDCLELVDCVGNCVSPDLVGDGTCQDGSDGGPDLRCAEHGDDGGDCGDCPEGEVPACGGGCASEALRGNDECDEVMNCDKNDNDGGDCFSCPPDQVVNCSGGCTYAHWINDGWCDSSLDCQETGWDGGDCEPECADDEVVDCLGLWCIAASAVGDGTCQDGRDGGPDLRCAEHGDDGGDCGDCPEGEVPACGGGCASEALRGNDECDEVMNCDKNDNDGGDCCPDGKIANCSGGCTYAYWIHDGTCDSSLDCQETGWDGGDCEPECADDEVLDCSGLWCIAASAVGDGTCQDGSASPADLACDAFELDGGDCACPEGEIPACGGGCAPDTLGDGTCDAALNCVKYGLDGDDCCPDGQIRGCDGSCVAAGLLGDGDCDAALNCVLNDFDHQDCSVCGEGGVNDCFGACRDQSRVGDGTCDVDPDGSGASTDFYCGQLGWDGGDCSACGVGEVVSCVGADGCVPDTRADGVCDAAMNCERNSVDGGDCCPDETVANCEGGCTSATWLGDDYCNAVLACLLTGFDDGDCIRCDDGETYDCAGTCFDLSRRGDGTCDDGAVDVDLNCALHGFDGGDCTECPAGTVSGCAGGCLDPTPLGDGVCDPEFSCDKNGFDGGDCCPEGELKDCAGVCVDAGKLSDGNCDDDLNCLAHGFDMGDCTGTCGLGGVHDCAGVCRDMTLIGDGTCHDGADAIDFNCEDHAYDDADCPTCDEGQVPGCAGGCVPDTLGDGVCDEALHCAKHDDDAGDCCPADRVADCDGGCTLASWISDGWCDSPLNCAATGWDGGDCTPR